MRFTATNSISKGSASIVTSSKGVATITDFHRPVTVRSMTAERTTSLSATL